MTRPKVPGCLGIQYQAARPRPHDWPRWSWVANMPGYWEVVGAIVAGRPVGGVVRVEGVRAVVTGWIGLLTGRAHG